jgi:hypothetical protein
MAARKKVKAKAVFRGKKGRGKAAAKRGRAGKGGSSNT